MAPTPRIPWGRSSSDRTRHTAVNRSGSAYLQFKPWPLLTRFGYRKLILYAVLKYAAMFVLSSGAPSRPDKVKVISEAGLAVILMIVKILLQGRCVSLNLHIEKTFRSFEMS